MHFEYYFNTPVMSCSKPPIPCNDWVNFFCRYSSMTPTAINTASCAQASLEHRHGDNGHTQEGQDRLAPPGEQEQTAHQDPAQDERPQAYIGAGDKRFHTGV